MFSRSARAALRRRRHWLQSTPHPSDQVAATPLTSSSLPSPLLPLLTPTRSFSSCSNRQAVPKYTTRNTSAWAAATETAHSVLVPPSAGPSSSSSHAAPSTSPSSSSSSPSALGYDDPLAAIHREIGDLKDSLIRLLGSSHPSLDTVARYYFQAEGKHLRPLLVLLMSQATNGLGGSGWEQIRLDARIGKSVDDALTQEMDVLNDWNPGIMGQETEGAMVFAEPFRIPRSGLPIGSKGKAPSSIVDRLDSLPTHTSGLEILPTQRRLASISEMIHVASLLHDDVIDTSPLRRGSPSAPSTFGNKLSILSGDFLLGRASVALARLGSPEVVELLATVLANLVEGEVLQLKATNKPELTPSKKGWEEYMRKTYLKTAALMAKSARASVILGGCGAGETKEGEWVKDVAYGYGRNLGIAFQLIDDALDFLPASSTLGKPSSGADLRLGLATAPVLFAWEQHASLGPLILRRFTEPGDVEIARDIVGKSDGLERTVELARTFAGSARELVEMLPESAARAELVRLTERVVDRVK